jgi:uncharacterized repeat protein (TIGR03806 family)
MLLAVGAGCAMSCLGQTLFLNFNTTGQYTNNFNNWNDNGGNNGGAYCYTESPTTGLAGGGGVSLFQNTDTTMTYNGGTWDFSTNGATLFLSLMFHANGQTSGNKFQFGIQNTATNGLNGNAGIAFESFRFVPNTATSLSLREQYRTTNSNIETVLGNINTIVGHWYRFNIALTNTGGPGNYNASCAIYDFGTTGVSPGTNTVNFSTLMTHAAAQDIATNPSVYVSLRGIMNAGVDALDNWLVYTPASKPVITLPLTNSLVAAGQTAIFSALAEGPGTITYAWYTNGILASGTSGTPYTSPPINSSYSNITVVASNGNGSATNSATITVFNPVAATVTNLPATSVQTTSATMNGQVLATGGVTPTVTLYYGTFNGGTNAAAWSNSVSMGAQSGAFSQPLSGLSLSTTYYYAAKAVNTAGTSWAVPSASFTTLGITTATLTNLPATSIQANAATLNGQVLSTGNDAPSITLYYGPVNGGTTAAAWSNNVALGVQGGIFSQTVTPLNTNTTYYYAARGSNAAGIAWATPSQSFTTLTTNPPAPAYVSVLTYHNDNYRSGQNTNELVLTLGNVNTNTFGLVLQRPVDDWVYAQPLIMTNVNVPARGTHNVLYVCTVNDTIYAFDADDTTGNAPFWQTNFLTANSLPPRNTDMTGACGGNYLDFHGNMGIVGTPVIDPVSSTLYVIVRTKENGTTFVQRLRALDLATGTERPYSPVIIAATIAGSGDGSVGGQLSFDPMKEGQRCGLALANGNIYCAFSSHCDWGPYHGWLIAYNASTFAQTAVFNTSRNGGLAGIWSSGDPPAIDNAGNLYFETGNGTFNTNYPSSTNYSLAESFIKVSPTNHVMTDYFTPYNQANLTGSDADVGSAGAMLLPDSVGSAAHPHLIVGGSKAGTIYLLDRDNLGKYNSIADTQVVQTIVSGMGQCYDTPAYFNNTIYMSGSGGNLRAYTFSGGMISPTTPTSQSPTTFGFSAPTASVSANGLSNGIVWALQLDGWGSGLPAILRAYNATNLAQEIYNSSQAGARDTAGGAVKFTLPVVANGKVYVGGQYALSVYATATNWVATPLISPNGGTFTNSVVVTMTDATPGAAIYYTLDNSAPTTSSILYTNPFVLSNSIAIRARAFKSGYVGSGLATASFLNALLVGNGIGLVGSYWSNSFPTNAFSGPASLVRTDAVVNFNWGTGSPDPSISVDHFTARWTGSVQPQFNETYTFYTSTDDGVRLYVNNQLIIDHWVDQGGTEWTGTIPLNAQGKYNIEMDYYENGGGAQASLSWSSPSTAKAIIPQSQLYTTTDAPPAVTITSPTSGSTLTAPASLTIVANATDPDGPVARVDYYANSLYLGSVSNSPFVLTATGVNSGSYFLRAVAYDSAGLFATSAPVVISISVGTGQPYGINSRTAAPGYYNMPATYNGGLPQRLSLTGVFSDTPSMTPVGSLIPYSVNVPLWSDGAIKTRWMSVPNSGAPYTPDEQILFTQTGEWSFPQGTVFVKHFDLATDETNPAVRRRLETRLLVRDSAGAVYGVTYKWRADNSDADLLTSSLSENVLITNASGIRTQVWYYPSPSDCLGCHTPAANYVLGVKTRQLNGNYTYPSSGVTDNQLRTLNHAGLFNPAFDEAAIPTYSKLSALTNSSAPLEERARSYIDANCAQCHRPGGPAPTFDGRYDTPLTNQNIINGVLQKGDLGYDNAKVVVPRDIYRSVLWDRMNTVDPTIKMPQIARNLIDTNAVQVMADWINSLPGVQALLPPVLNPTGGTFVASVLVALQGPDTNATLRYTLDGSLPTTNSILYAGPITLTNSLTLSAKAFEPGYNESVAANGLFTLRPGVYFPPGSAYFSNNQFLLPFSGLAGKSYLLQASTDFTNWQTLSTNVAPANMFDLIDSSASNYPLRFYRVVELP